MQNQIELPRYKCHKTVHALRIAGISLPQNEKGDAMLSFSDEKYAPKLMERAWLDKHNPEVGGYLVVYSDGYQSYSPAKAFEDGYSLDQGDACEESAPMDATQYNGKLRKLVNDAMNGGQMDITQIMGGLTLATMMASRAMEQAAKTHMRKQIITSSVMPKNAVQFPGRG